MRRSVSLDDNYDDDDEEFGLSNSLYAFLTIFMLMTEIVLIMYRAARPRELDSVFEVFDVNLESQQLWLEKAIGSVCRYFDLNPPSNPARMYKTPNGIKITSNEYYGTTYNALKNKNLEIRAQIKAKLKELERSKKIKSKRLKEFGILNQELKITMEAKLKFNDPFEEIDRVFNEVYRKQFDILVCQALIKDLISRTEKITKLKDYVKSHRSEFHLEQLPNKIFVSITATRDIANKIIIPSSIEKVTHPLSYVPLLETWKLKVSELNWSPESQDNDLLPTNIVSDSDDITTDEMSLCLLKEFQSIEREMFLLKQRDMEYFERIHEIDDQITVYDEFIRDLRSDLSNGGTIKYTNKWKHLHKQSERINRLNQVYDAQFIQKNLFEAWHRRNLLEIYTKPELIYYDKTEGLYQGISGEYNAKLHLLWNDGMSAEMMLAMFSDKAAGSKFSLDLAMKKYEKFKGKNSLKSILNNLKNPWTQIKTFIASAFTNVAIYPDSMLFSMIALYNKLAADRSDYERSNLRNGFQSKVNNSFL